MEKSRLWAQWITIQELYDFAFIKLKDNKLTASQT